MSLRARGFGRLGHALVVAGLAACNSLPPRGAVEASAAFTDTHGTTLGRVATSSTTAGASGFALLPAGGPAFDARSALAARAERSLDAQYYHLHPDPAGAEFLRELRDASRRGVRVRLLVDDLHAAASYPLLTGLAAHPGVQVRLFNPLPTREGDAATRLADSALALQLGRINYRMHNKLFVADNAVAIFGGRNIADEYFMRHGEANFVDLDVIAAGPVVRELSHSFDDYWNSQYAYPLHDLVPAPADPAQARDRFDQAVGAMGNGSAPSGAADQRVPTSAAAQLAAGQLELHSCSARVHADPPSKAGSRSRDWAQAFKGVTDMIAAAQTEALVVTPYFVPGGPQRVRDTTRGVDFDQRGMEFIKTLVGRGVRLRVLTNSLGSSDVPLVHAAYEYDRVALLRLGVELYELRPDAGRGNARLGRFGESIARLHTKLVVVDGRWLAAGSVNMDSRSAIYNIELAVVLDCPALAREATRLILDDYEVNMYRLRLAEDGRTIEWLTRDPDGRMTVTTEEPHGERRVKWPVDTNLL